MITYRYIRAALALASTYGSSAAATCAPPPVPITIGNSTLSNNQVARGLQVSIGNPPQPFVFLPQWPLNNTFVYGTDGHCTFSAAGCTTRRGGAYDMLASKSRSVADKSSYPSDSAPFPPMSFVSDTFSLGQEANLSGFPLGIPLNDWGEEDYHPMNAVGLGDNSTLLRTLKSTGKIASRAWSMFWGRNGALASAQLDGIFVLGGYDKAKTQGQPLALPLADNTDKCPTRMLITISDLILNFSNGTNASLFPKAASNAIQACIVPDYPVLMTLPLDPYFGNFETLTNQSLPDRSLGLVYFANRYSSNDNVYTGDLTINFESGFSVRIPNDQLVVPHRQIDTTTGEITANATGPDLVILSTQDINKNDITQLGRQFLSAAYLMVNLDANQFTLWEANPTDTRQLVAVDETNAEIASVCDGNSPPPPSPPPVTHPDGGGSGSSLSSGAIAGIAVAVVAFIVIVSAILFVWRRRQRRSAAGGISDKFPPHTYGYNNGVQYQGSSGEQVYKPPQAPGELPVPEPGQRVESRRYELQ
ncbi:acid protease [Echria macrotheca]|uniref:Acid protease n=1 Tax=Echria macrotheca TaxID=438768 RepID=A0AAJ0BKA6_9PEZI|nr:acid protease [Echria macrotheca]